MSSFPYCSIQSWCATDLQRRCTVKCCHGLVSGTTGSRSACCWAACKLSSRWGWQELRGGPGFVPAPRSVERKLGLTFTFSASLTGLWNAKSPIKHVRQVDVT
ncbi:hypothetical protein BDQ94DRAFT_20742 [Aspergillus welwitschiae]|uniref:Uncharacterized protein n=1 Tax=Aspergillus welwitschiae TaxID=1341132 RepID=A0A3F3Q5U8_9EURO|nr:hypothetical protein BDQ94DRAFT_20742 [Aspergillus welwitschiae]RDH34551.1 hypothetical protein BDQ94DRAFT_20742 [Aspergillus welwitschiae]